MSAVQGSGTQGLEVVVGTGASATTEGLGAVIMSGFGTGGAGTPTGSAGAGISTIRGFQSGAVRSRGLGLWAWAWAWVLGTGVGGLLWLCI